MHGKVTCDIETKLNLCVINQVALIWSKFARRLWLGSTEKRREWRGPVYPIPKVLSFFLLAVSLKLD
jgi:hypothetical protein